METKSIEGFLIKFCAFRRQSEAKAKKGMLVIMAELTTLKNIGKEIERKLKSIGIHSAEELKETGSKDTWF